MTSVQHQSAIVRLAQARSPRLRLLCFPQAGGGSATFRPLAAVLPPTVDLCAVRLPGRETRRREPVLHGMDDVLVEVMTALTGLDDLPMALLGYCSGSIIAYRVAQELAVSRGKPPVRLIVLASPGPRVVPTRDWVHPLSRPGLVERLRRFQVTPDLILDDADLFDIFEPGVRADFEVFETWDYRPGPPLDLPITVIGAREDASVAFDELLMWHDHTNREFTVRIMPGGHNFLGSATSRLGEMLASDLRDR
jgi:surfactin synthase thioesterase subunit